MKDVIAVVLAAGLGTRMKSRTHKGLHLAAGRPLLWYPVKAALEAGVGRVVVVVGHQGDDVRRTLGGLLAGAPLEYAVQAEQLGTAHATLCARPQCDGFGTVVVINGDLPLLQAPTVTGVVEAFRATGGHFALASAVLPDPRGFGRIVRGADGDIAAIVEERDATPEQAAVRESNVGVYAARADLLFGMLADVGTGNAKKEFYFTDIVRALRGRGDRVGVYVMPDASESVQVNDRIGLAEAEAGLQRRKALALMAAGVTLRRPETVLVDDGVTVGPDTELGPCVELHGATAIGSGCTIGHGAVLTNTTVGDGVSVKPYCVFTDAVIEDEAQLGPFSHLRPASVVRHGAHVGNFVEMKKTVLGPGSKANHLSYLGDSTIGRKVNIGAGTITCNYDGVNKLPTEIDDGAFIGSDTQLVAPVKVGKDAYVAAGTTVTKDVPPGALALSRVAQTHVMGYAERRKAKK